ncbi:hypothetical protein F4553_005330 [Allocatelliglobosispora scoriae]|uniref:NERD domain-containing protein n=1 Tax=Allocatelliglobosispora scoriae TaxID=643052 RepID=A0A841BZ58_9ACTN|nr:hypothetical protein [Allocatelliglobosispora scoriae]MBB5871951.1 hypothetical protein [Allocatelliglobosispora scoriae]
MPKPSHPPTSRDLVFDSLKVSLRNVGVGRGPWDAATADAAIGQIADAVELDIRKRLGDLNTREVVRWAAGEMAHWTDLQFKARTAAPSSLARAREAQLHAENAAAVHLVLELAARQPADGRRRDPSQRDLEALAILAHELWRWRTVADRVAARLVTVVGARLTKRGTFDVEVRDLPPLRLSQFENAYVRRMADDGPLRSAGDNAVLQALVRSLKSGSAIPGDLAAIDAALKDDRGYGLVDLFAAQEFLIQVSGAHDDSVTGYLFSSRESLEDTVRANMDQLLPAAHLDGVLEACRHLIWTQALLQDSPLQMLEYRESVGRLYSRPVLELADLSLFVPRNAPGLARVVLLQRIFEGTWPEHLSASDASLSRALKQRRERVRPIAGFEADLKGTLASTGLPFVVGVRQSVLHRPSDVLGVPVRAEIDAVVVAVHSLTIWVVEAKDLAVPFSPRRIRGEVNNYHRVGRHVDKLLAKVKDLAANPAEVAGRLGVADVAGTFAVRGLFVTREPTPAAFTDDRTHDFVTLDRLPDFLWNEPSS